MWSRLSSGLPGPTRWPYTCDLTSCTGWSHEELLYGVVHNCKVVWRGQAAFSEERAPLRSLCAVGGEDETVVLDWNAADFPEVFLAMHRALQDELIAEV